jgi:hypothetical protein
MKEDSYFHEADFKEFSQKDAQRNYQQMSRTKYDQSFNRKQNNPTRHSINEDVISQLSNEDED